VKKATFGGIICIHEQRITFCKEGSLYINIRCFPYVPAYTITVIKPILKVIHSTAAQYLASYQSTADVLRGLYFILNTHNYMAKFVAEDTNIISKQTYT